MRKANVCILLILLPFTICSQAFGIDQNNPPRVAVLSSALARDNPIMRPFDERLQELGYSDGWSITIDYRNAEGRLEQLDDFAVELSNLKPDVIVAPGPDAVLRAFHQLNLGVPIVMIAVDYDPMTQGYIHGYDKPGGLITGISIRRVEFNTKRLELLKEILPTVDTVILLADDFGLNLLAHTEADAKALGLTLKVHQFQNPPYDFDSALSVSQDAGAVMTLASPVFFRQRHDLFAAAARYRLPVIYGVTLGVADGALLGYGPSFPAASARAADYVDRILKGANPAELPVEQSDRFDLAINLRVAKTLNIVIPASILLRADEVIE